MIARRHSLLDPSVQQVPEMPFIGGIRRAMWPPVQKEQEFTPGQRVGRGHLNGGVLGQAVQLTGGGELGEAADRGFFDRLLVVDEFGHCGDAFRLGSEADAVAVGTHGGR